MSPIFNLVASSQGGGEGNGAERQWRAGTRVGLKKQSPFLVPALQFTHQDGCTGNTPVMLLITTGPLHMLFPLPGMLLTLSCSWLTHIHPSDPTQPPFLLDILLLPDQVRSLCYALTALHSTYESCNHIYMCACDYLVSICLPQYCKFLRTGSMSFYT